MQTSKTQHILIVDDDWMNREVLEAHLQTRNYRVSSAGNGVNALKFADNDPPDLIMLDVMLPDMSGYEICSQFKAHDKTRFAPVVMVTALESDADRIKAIEAGADDFVTKPFNSLLMLTRVASLLKMKQLNDDLQDRTALLQKILNRYVDEDIANIILVDPDRYLKLGGETRQITVVFADISGFTSFSEQHSPTEVVNILNKIFSELTILIFQHHGTFDKYIGDEIMAFFGAPVSTGEDSLNAVKTAWAMQQTFKRVIQGLGEGYQHLTLEIGIHTGAAVVGNVGSEQRMNYTAIGDTVNTAHRLQDVAKNGQILMSEVTYHEVAELLVVSPPQPHTVQGKRDPIITYQLIGLKT